ncbi:MAG: heme utilization protein [Pseudomonas sp.]
MNTKHKITAIAFVVAASLSMGAMAKGGPSPKPTPVPTPTPEQQEGLSSATVLDAQISLGNSLENVETTNNAGVESSLAGGSGNAGVNVVAGDTNQQANALAISTADADADADFVFGTLASIGVLQVNGGNTLSNQAVTNNATADDVANGYSGNLGLNVAAGGFNQQKNDAAIANASEAQNAEAAIEVLQVAVAGNTYNGVETDTLSMVATGWKPKPGPAPEPGIPNRNLDVENNANLVSSLNGFSGNAGVNIAAGGANQQSNTLSIAAGCTGCP